MKNTNIHSKRGHGILLVCVLVIAGLLYFKPIRLSDHIKRDQRIELSVTNFHLIDDQAQINFEEIHQMSDLQKDQLITLFENYPYKRTLGTLFSAGSIEGVGEKLVTLFFVDHDQEKEHIIITESGKMLFKDKTYKMDRAGKCIQALLDILTKGT